MKICIAGAGAIGGLIGAKFALAGEDVTLIDQGAHLAAIQDKGLKLIWDGEHVISNAKVTDNLEEAGPQDLVVLAVKAHYLEQVAPKIPSVTGPGTMILTVQNGIPWWYFHNHAGPSTGAVWSPWIPTGCWKNTSIATASSVASPTRRATCPSPASSATWRATASPSGSWTVGIASVRRPSTTSSSRPGSGLGSSTTSAPRSGSRHGGTCPSTRSAP